MMVSMMVSEKGTGKIWGDKIATQLGLKPTGKAIALGVNSRAIVNRYFVVCFR
jgi:hypothetical protein